MKKIILTACCGLLLTGCQLTHDNHSNGQVVPKIGMPNPASVYCTEQGGKLAIKDEANGQVGYCHLPDGQVVEEWAFFRASLKLCKAEEAKKLLGQTQLSEEKIKELTQSSQVRIVGPNQPVTMDYREDRVTVTVDPATKKITQASCG